MAIPNEIVDQVLSVAKIEEVIGEFITLKKRGKDYVGLCPFHSEKTPSFYVSPSKGIYKCFGCGRGGGVITFLKAHEKMGFVDAIRYLAAKYGIPVPEDVDDEVVAEEERLRKRLISLMEYAYQHYRKMLGSPMGQTARTYLHDRGIPEALIDRFGLGWASPNERLSERLLQMGTESQLLETAGLGRLKGKRWQDVFRDRLIFPIFSVSGRPIGFAGRLLGNIPNAPKYLNSPDTPLFHKSSVLYGLYHARDGIRKQGFAIVVEGYFDVLAVHHSGLCNAVAPMGTSLTPHQLKILRRFTDRVVFLMDGDIAGQRATLKGFQHAADLDFKIEAVRLPAGEDPDSLMRSKGPLALAEYIGRRTHFLEYILSLYSLDDPEAKSEAVHQALGVIARFSDAVRQSTYVQKLSSLAQIPVGVLSQRLGQVISEYRRSIQSPPPLSKVSNEPPPLSSDLLLPARIEHGVVEMAILHGDKPWDEEHSAIEWIYQQTALAQWNDKGLKELFDWIYKYYTEHGRMPTPMEIQRTAPLSLHSWLSGVWMPPKISAGWRRQAGRTNVEIPFKEQVGRVLAFFEMYQLTQRWQAIRQQIESVHPDEDASDLWGKLHEIHEHIHQLAHTFGLSLNPFTLRNAYMGGSPPTKV